MGISALTVGFLKLSFETNSGARTLEHVILGRAYAKSGIYRVFAAINDRKDPFERLVANSTKAHNWQLDETPIELNLESESAKIDVNYSDIELIKSFMRLQNVSAEHINYVENRILNARLREDTLRLEDVYWPLLLYFDWPTFHSSFTERNSRGKIDITKATADVLRAIPDLTSGQIDEFLRARDAGDDLPPLQSKYLASGGDVYSITALVRFAPNRRFYMRMPIKVFSSGGAEALSSPHI